MNKKVDLAIIGGGIAGASAALYSKRAGLEFLLFEPAHIGGQLLLMESVDNYIGLPLGTQGHALAQSLENTLQEMAIKPIQSKIDNVRKDDSFILECTDQTYYTHGIIIATGAAFKKLGVTGEAELSGKGVSYCAICDGFFFKNKDVAVIGGGNTAIEDALYLSNICKKVYVVHRRSNLRAMSYLQEKLLKKTNVEIIFDTVVKEIQGKTCVESLLLEHTIQHSEKTVRVNGVFVAIGVTPKTEFVSGMVSMDKEGFIETNECLETSQKGIWACGDCRKRPLRQLITAASEGALAAISAYKHIKGFYISA